jgi:hypothetical protein
MMMVCCLCSLVDEEDRNHFLAMLTGAYLSPEPEVNLSMVAKVRSVRLHHHQPTLRSGMHHGACPGVSPQCATRDGRRMLAVVNVRHVHDLRKRIFMSYLSIQPLHADSKHMAPGCLPEPTALPIASPIRPSLPASALAPAEG